MSVQQPTRQPVDRRAICICGAGAGVLAIIGAFLPWLSIQTALGSVNFSGTVSTPEGPGDGVWVLVGGAAMGACWVLALFNFKTWLAGVALIAALAVAALGGAHLEPPDLGVNAAYAAVSVGPGVYVALIAGVGGVLLAIASVWSVRSVPSDAEVLAAQPPPQRPDTSG